MADKLSEAEINLIRMKEQVSDPDNPIVGYQYGYVKDDGFYVKLSDGTVIGPLGAGTDSDSIHDNVSGEISAITEKTTPVDADVTLIEDSAAANAKKKLSWANIKATIKTYFDTLYATVAHTHDHGTLTGLGDDDHSQYATNAEFDDHSARHASGGADALKLDDLAAPDDNTDLNATNAAHGLLLKLDDDPAHFLSGEGAWATPPGVLPEHWRIFTDEFFNAVGTVVVTHDATLNYGFEVENTSTDNADGFDVRFFLKAGTYEMFVLGSLGPDCGILDFEVDTVNVATGMDWYDAAPTPNTVQSTTVNVDEDGEHTLTVVVNGKNASSTDYRFGITKIWFVPGGPM